MSNPRILHFPAHGNDRGRLTVAEAVDSVPFEIRRAFWITEVPDDVTRGGHAHTQLHQVLVCLHGMVTVKAGETAYCLWLPSRGLYVPPFTRLDMYNWAPGTVLLVLCSEHYDAGDYVYD